MTGRQDGNAARVAIVEPRAPVRRRIARALAGRPRLRVVAAVTGAPELAALGLRPDVVVAGLPSGLDGDDLLDERAASGRVLILLDRNAATRVTELLRAGAYGCVADQADDDELLRAVDAVARGGFHVSPELAVRLRAELRRPPAAALSTRPAPSALPALGRRETETLRLLTAGLTHGQIARRMGLAETTVSTYVKRIRGKLDVGNKADLTRAAIELGLTTLAPPTAGSGRHA